MKQTLSLLVFSLCVASCLGLRQTRSSSSTGVTSNFSNSKLPVMLDIPQYKRDCWQKRPVSTSLLQGGKNPGAGLEPFTPYEVVLKDGFMPIDCVKDKLFLHGDKFGDGKFSYNLENVSNVSIVHYTDIVPKEDRKPMTQKVCFEFCRTVPEMGFFGIFMGRDCYCTPFYKMVADDSSDCDQLCEGDTTLVCGGKSKSSIFSMHMCSSTKSDLKKAKIATDMVVGQLSDGIILAEKLSKAMQASADLNQKIFGKAGDPASSDLMQVAKVFAGELEETAVSAERVKDQLDGLVKKSAELDESGKFEKSDVVTSAERLMEKMDEGEEEGAKHRRELGKITKLAHPGEEELGSAHQYYPVMYFVDKKYTETLTTCDGPLVDKPIVGESLDGCASACDAEIHNCVGFMYYGTGEASLCFLYSGFKSAMYWTGCNAKPEKEFLQIHANTSGNIKVKPWDCSGGVSPAWQSQTDDNGVTTINRLDVKTGAYSKLFEIPKDRTKPPFRNINSCGINPKDSILYCSMQINNAGAFLVRIDASTVGFVSKLPQWQYSGTFDSKGNYYVNGKKSWSYITSVQDMPAKSSLYELSGEPFTQTMFTTEKEWGTDLAVLEEDLYSTGTPQTYLLTIRDTTVKMTRVDKSPFKTTELAAKGLPAGKGWASAWAFKSDIFFAAEDGTGIYQFDKQSIDLGAKTVKFHKAGPSNALVYNDGFACPKLASSIPDMRPTPRPFTPTTTTTTTKKDVTTTKKRSPDEPPKVGEVKCMAKLSKFEGTTLKPNPSGKCKQCMRKLVKAQRCYEL